MVGEDCAQTGMNNDSQIVCIALSSSSPSGKVFPVNAVAYLLLFRGGNKNVRNRVKEFQRN